MLTSWLNFIKPNEDFWEHGLEKTWEVILNFVYIKLALSTRCVPYSKSFKLGLITTLSKKSFSYNLNLTSTFKFLTNTIKSDLFSSRNMKKILSKSYLSYYCNDVFFLHRWYYLSPRSHRLLCLFFIYLIQLLILIG